MKPPIRKGSTRYWPLRQHPVHRSKLRRKPLQKILQRRNILIRSRVGMQANRPNSRFLLHRSPKLLRNPNQPVIPKRPLRKPIRDKSNSRFAQNPQRHKIETMPRSHKNSWPQSPRPHHLQTSRNPLSLQCERSSSKLCHAMPRNQTASSRRTKMPVAMQANCGSGSLQRPHLIPKPRIRQIPLKLQIAIIRNNRQNRPHAIPLNQPPKPLPPPPVHRRAKIVKPQQILRLRKTTLHAAGPSEAEAAAGKSR